MSTLTLVRHGQASFDADHYDQLSPLGVLQAQATARFFVERRLQFTAVYSGPRERQRWTAAEITGALGLPHATIRPALDEFAEGGALMQAAEQRLGQVLDHTQVSRQDRLRHYGEQIRLWARDEISVPGVMRAPAFRATVAGWLNALTGSNERGQYVLAATSAGVIAAIVCELMQRPDDDLATIMSVIGNGSLTTLVWSSRGRSLTSFNQTAHLPAHLVSEM